MPLPSRKPTEDRDDFIARCVIELEGEFPDRRQRVAVCYNQLRAINEQKTK